jgi:hypothetical protein
MNYVVCKRTNNSVINQRASKNQPHYLRSTRRA